MRGVSRAVAIAITGTIGATFGLIACTAPPFFGRDSCDANAFIPLADCIDAGSDADAGVDASDDGGGGGSTAKNACPGRCVPAPSGTSAGSWSDKIVSLWTGPLLNNKVPTCPPGPDGSGVPAMAYTRYDKLVAPPAECEPCECGASEGTCTGLPDSIEIRAGTCAQSGVSSLPFDGPPAWDGSCSNEGALPAGKLCNGVPCAQSVWASPLPGPKTESCAPTKVTPKATLQAATWETVALACYANTMDDACGDSNSYCLNDPGLSWLFCVYYESKEENDIAPACPDNFNYARHVKYPQEPVDDRGCEACLCGEPAGSGCLATMHVYGDGACASELYADPISSFVDQCSNISVPGSAIGGKSITDLAYMPGICAASGGAPKGSATASMKNAVTFCCASLFDDGELEPPK